MLYTPICRTVCCEAKMDESKGLHCRRSTASANYRQVELMLVQCILLRNLRRYSNYKA